MTTGTPTVCMSTVGAEEALLFKDTNAGHEKLKEADLILVFGMDPMIQDLIHRIYGNDGLPALIQVEEDPSALMGNDDRWVGVYTAPAVFLSAIEMKSVDTKARFSHWRKEVVTAEDDTVKVLAASLDRSWKWLYDIAPQLSEKHILIVDGWEAITATACLLRKARYRDLMSLFVRCIMYHLFPSRIFLIVLANSFFTTGFMTKA